MAPLDIYFGHFECIVHLLIFVLLVISTVLLETSLSSEVTDKAVCCDGDISIHYWKAFLTIIVGIIIVFHVLIEIGFYLYISSKRIWKDLCDHVNKVYLTRRFSWKDIVNDLGATGIIVIIVSITLLPYDLEISALIDVIGAEFRSSSLVNERTPQSNLCCGSSVYTHGLIPNSSAARPPSLNFLNNLLHCTAPHFPKNSSTPTCCCFEPTRVVSYLNLEACNIFIFFLRVLLCCFLGCGVFILDNLERADVRRRRIVVPTQDIPGDRNSRNVQLESHDESNRQVAYHLRAKEGPASTAVLAPPKLRGVGKFTCAAGQIRDQIKHDILMARQLHPDDLVHLAYTFHACTIEYWMDLSLHTVTVNGAYNVHQIDIQNYVTSLDTVEVIKDSFNGFVVVVKSGEVVKGLILADSTTDTLKVESPDVYNSRIEIRTPRMPIPNIFGERIFSHGDESRRSVKLGDILIECRLDVYLGVTQILNERFSGHYTNIKLGIKKYSKNDSIRTEGTAGGLVQIVIKNNECRGVAFVYAPKKVMDHVTILPGKDTTNSDFFVSFNFRDR